MRIKPGVDLRGIQPEMTIAMSVAKEVYYGMGGTAWIKDFTLTSALDGTHSVGSLHYVGLAVDLRTRHVPTSEHHALAEKLKEALGADPDDAKNPELGQYDIYLHSTHIHIEFDPDEGDVRREMARDRTTRADPKELVQFV